MKSVVVTGANGFIGRHLIPVFLQQGVDVYAMVAKSDGRERGFVDHPRLHVVECDLLCCPKTLPSITLHPDAFIHLAWVGVSPETRTNFEFQIRNIELCLNAVRLANCIDAGKFILSGSTLEYVYCGEIINQKALPTPRDAYSSSKVAAHYLCQELCRELGVPFIYTVISSIYSEDRQDNNVIYYTITKLLAGEIPKLTGLKQQWDYVHIDDVVRAFYLIALKGKAGAFYSIGRGDNWPLCNYIQQIHAQIDPSLPLGIGQIPYPTEQLPESCVDLQPLRKDTGFVPEIPFDVGISRVIEKIKNEKEEASRTSSL